MSYNKNTIRSEKIDTITSLCRSLNIPYKLTILGKVEGYGLNDETYDDTLKKYKIQRLEVGDDVYLEQMIRTNDCDTDDVIVCKKFKKSDEPKRWKIEKTIENS